MGNHISMDGIEGVCTSWKERVIVGTHKGGCLKDSYLE
jgi:hypothetical protein